MKGITENMKNVNESLLALIALTVVAGSFASEFINKKAAAVAGWRSEYDKNKLEQERTKWQQEEEKMKHELAKIRLAQQIEAENAKGDQKKKADEFGKSLDRVLADKYDEKDKELMKDLEKKSKQYSKEQLDKVKKDINAISDEAADDHLKKIKSETEDEPKEEIVKDKDGSEIHARPKKRGEGKTYIRMKGGKEIGYASKNEFKHAKKNENLSLKNYLIENLR